MANDRNLVLTGLSCGGTTLSCYLIGKVSDTVASNEPLHRIKLLSPRLFPQRAR